MADFQSYDYNFFICFLQVCFKYLWIWISSYFFFLQKIIAYRNYVRNIVKLVFGNGTSSFAVAYLRLTVNEVLDFEQRLNQVHV